jgi:hypothetical protein
MRLSPGAFGTIYCQRGTTGCEPRVSTWYVFSEVFDLKPTSGLCLKNSAHLSNFLTPRTVSAIHIRPEGPAPKGLKDSAQG